MCPPGSALLARMRMPRSWIHMSCSWANKRHAPRHVHRASMCACLGGTRATRRMLLGGHAPGMRTPGWSVHSWGIRMLGRRTCSWAHTRLGGRAPRRALAWEACVPGFALLESRASGRTVIDACVWHSFFDCCANFLMPTIISI